MKCLTLLQVRDYADGELVHGEKRKVEEHLASCPACRALLEKIGRFDAVIRASSSPPFGRPPLADSECPGAEAIAALMEDGIEAADERARVAAHVARCPACAVKAAEAMETSRLVERLEARGLESPPGTLVEAVRAKVRAKVRPEAPAMMGEIVASIRELIDRFASWAGGAPASAAAVVAEACADFTADRPTPAPPAAEKGAKPPSPRTRAKAPRGGKGRRSPERTPAAPPRPPEWRRWALERTFLREDLAILVSLAANERRTVECTVRLTDRSGKPVAAVPVEMRKGTATLSAEPTGIGGEALFSDLVSGQYHFLIRRGGGARIGVTLH